jgi:predicted nucleic acid-binding protein
MDAFDADALIYAATPGHPLGRRLRALFPETVDEDGHNVGVGSTLLVPEVLGKPLREGNTAECDALATILGRLELRPLDRATANLAALLAAEHRLKASDAVHLATAVAAGADRFITNNQRDFPRALSVVTVTYPADLDDPD